MGLKTQIELIKSFDILEDFAIFLELITDIGSALYFRYL